MAVSDVLYDKNACMKKELIVKKKEKKNKVNFEKRHRTEKLRDSAGSLDDNVGHFMNEKK